MFGLMRKKKLLEEMNRLKESGKKENNGGGKYPPANETELAMNSFWQGYEDGHDNFYNALYGKFFKKK